MSTTEMPDTSKTVDTSATKEEAASKPPIQKQGKRERADKVERQFVKEFVDANTHIAVRVQKTMTFRPFYSLVLGRFIENDHGETWIPFIRVNSEVEHAKVKRSDDHSKVIAELVKEACTYIGEQLQMREDEIIMQKQDREKRQMDREKGPGQKPGLKQLSKIDRETKSYAKTGT